VDSHEIPGEHPEIPVSFLVTGVTDVFRTDTGSVLIEMPEVLDLPLRLT